MRLHPVSWLLFGVLSFVLVDAALRTAIFVNLWRDMPGRWSEGALGLLMRLYYNRVGARALEDLTRTIGLVVWLEILWRTLRGLRLRRQALETALVRRPA